MKNYMRTFSVLLMVFALAFLSSCAAKTTTEPKATEANSQPTAEAAETITEASAVTTKAEETVNETSEATTEAEEAKTEAAEERNLELGMIKDVDPNKKVYITAQEAKEIMDKGGQCVVAEVTWGEEKDSPDFLKKHIPGAIHINTDMVEEGPIWNLRSPEELEKNFLNYGITSDTVLILYGPGIAADRVAYAALYLGVKSVKIIDGRLAAWEKAGYPVEEGSATPSPQKDFGVQVPAHPEYVISLEDTVKKLEEDKEFKLVSVRSREEWEGKTSGYSYIPKAGEPKGAVFGESGTGNSGMENYMNADETVKSFADIVKLWKDNGFDLSNDMAFYCGTGWRAATPWLLMYERGYDVKMFDGGWNEWQMHNELEAEINDPDGVKVVPVKDLTPDKAAK